MDIRPYQIQYEYNHNKANAEVRPCCQEDNVVDYAIYLDGQLAFNIIRSEEKPGNWLISLKNADKEIDEGMIQAIGDAIDQHNRK